MCHIFPCKCLGFPMWVSPNKLNLEELGIKNGKRLRKIHLVHNYFHKKWSTLFRPGNIKGVMGITTLLPNWNLQLCHKNCDF